ncbi:hypothetical protein RSAG8_10128, partial [Rhizoctonia solani AG-8 WAC10335]
MGRQGSNLVAQILKFWAGQYRTSGLLPGVLLGSLYNFVGAEPSFSGFLSHQGVVKTTVALWAARAVRSHFGWQV